jgi:hypothetical protein
MNSRSSLWIIACASMALCAGCGRESGSIAEAAPPAQLPAGDPSAVPAQPVSAPAVPAFTPSYEVAIATAAADHTNGLEQCAALPDEEREACRDTVNAAYEAAREAAQSGRGDSQ